MSQADQYPKVVEWSAEDACFVGTCPGLFYGGCHGEDQFAVFTELCQIVEETIALYKEDGKPLPEPTNIRSWDALTATA
jgi:predicted RNase H-like HicB family nuclease